MKKTLFILLLFSSKLLAQQSIYSTEKNNYLILKSENDSFIITFQICQLYNHFYDSKYIKTIDTCYNSHKNEFIFEGKKSIVYLGENIMKLNKLDKKLELPLIKNKTEINTYLKDAYWWMKYIMVCNSLNLQYKLGHKSFFSGHEIDEKFKNNVCDFTTYKTLADKHFSVISDSLIKQAKYYTSIAEWLNTNQSDTLYDSIKIKILLLINSDYYGKSFMEKAIDSLAYSNPNIFYRLTNEFKFKSDFYNSISKKSNIKLLNSSCNKADIKEYKKYKRNELIAPIAYLSIIVLEIAGVSFGIHKLIKH